MAKDIEKKLLQDIKDVLLEEKTISFAYLYGSCVVNDNFNDIKQYSHGIGKFIKEEI
jgi:hypothetical protein